MKREKFYLLSICLFISVLSCASHKVYLVHGYCGLGVELEKIHRAIIKEGFTCEIVVYPSLSEDVDSVGKHLFQRIRQENFDTISFVTHSMGALVVRSLHHYVQPEQHFPFIHRIIMIAPPNNGSPVADFFAQFGFLEFIVGPNVRNLTTDSKSGAQKYAVPTCEVGLILGIKGNEVGYNSFIKGDDDGLVPAETSKLGIETDVAYIKDSHVGLILNKKVIRITIAFLKRGKFG